MMTGFIAMLFFYFEKLRLYQYLSTMADDGGIFEGETGGAGFYTFDAKFRQWYAICSCETAWYREWEPDT
jgi:hypothetical protein